MPFGPKLSAPPTIEELTALHAWLNRPEEMRCAPPALPPVASGDVANTSGSHSEAEMVPDSLRDGCSGGERRLFAILQRLPREYVVYHEPKTGSSYASFVVIGPRFGLLVVKCCGLRSNQLAGAEAEASPVNEARGYFETITERCASQSGFDVLVAGSAPGERDFIFPSGYLALLSNISQGELAERDELASSFPSSRTITRDLLESWRGNEAFTGEHVADALRFFLQGRVLAFPLKDGQIRALRAVVHPEIRLAERPEPVNEGTEGEPAYNIDIAVLDLRQERHARSLGSGHRLIYGVAGSGKTVLLIARARHLAAQYHQQRILFLCFNVTLATYLRTKLADCNNVSVHHFDGWARDNHHVSRRGGERHDEFGQRLLATLEHRGEPARVNDTVLIDEAHDFAPVWFKCALATMKEPRDGDLVIVGDASQGLYRQTGVSWRSLGIQAQGRTVHRAFDLDRNYRNTREIVALAQRFASQAGGSEEEGMLCLAVDPAKAHRSIGMVPVFFKERFRSTERNRIVALVRGLRKGAP